MQRIECILDFGIVIFIGSSPAWVFCTIFLLSLSEEIELWERARSRNTGKTDTETVLETEITSHVADM